MLVWVLVLVVRVRQVVKQQGLPARVGWRRRHLVQMTW
jgi:hypothetical protein